MAKYSKNNVVSEQTKKESMAIAKGIQKPGQTKEQTKLVAQGIQKGIDQYKKQQKAKARAMDKANKKSVEKKEPTVDTEELVVQPKTSVLPWVLLCLSWVGFIGVYIFR